MCKKEGCTCWFDGVWKHCCDSHDSEYGSKKLSRFESDLNLFKCVWNKNKVMAVAMFSAVRVVGWIFWFKLLK